MFLMHEDVPENSHLLTTSPCDYFFIVPYFDRGGLGCWAHMQINKRANYLNQLTMSGKVAENKTSKLNTSFSKSFSISFSTFKT